MPHGDKDARVGQGYVTAGSIREPTLARDPRCQCTWIVVRAGPGMECISEMKYASGLCPVRHQRAEVLPAVFRAS